MFQEKNFFFFSQFKWQTVILCYQNFDWLTDDRKKGVMNGKEWTKKKISLYDHDQHVFPNQFFFFFFHFFFSLNLRFRFSFSFWIVYLFHLIFLLYFSSSSSYFLFVARVKHRNPKFKLSIMQYSERNDRMNWKYTAIWGDFFLHRFFYPVKHVFIGFFFS